MLRHWIYTSAVESQRHICSCGQSTYRLNASRMAQGCGQVGRWHSHPASAPRLSAGGFAPRPHVLCISENVLEILIMVTFYFTAGGWFKKGSCDLYIRLSLNNLLVSDAVRLHAEFLFVPVATFQSHDLFSPLNHK